MDELDEVAKLRGKLRFVDGQVHMLMGFLLAIIDTHPDPAELARHFEVAATRLPLVCARGLLPQPVRPGHDATG
jgi:hypothetical protein